MNDHLARFQLRQFAAPRQRISAFAADFQRGIDRRHLPLHAAETCAQRYPVHRIQRRRRGFADDRAAEVASIRFRAEGERRLIGLVAVQKIAAELARLAEQHRQQPGGKGIKRAAMPRLLRLIKPARLLQRLVAADTGGFVEQ